MFQARTRTGRLLHTQAEYKTRTPECEEVENRLRFISDKILTIKANIDVYNYVNNPKHKLLIDYANRFFFLTINNCYKTIAVELRAVLDREIDKEKICKKKGMKLQRGNTIFGLMDYALEYKDKLFEKERTREIQWSDGEITKDVDQLQSVEDLITDIEKKIDSKKKLLEILRMTRNKAIAHFDLSIPERAIYFSEMNDIVNDLSNWLDMISVRYNGVCHGYITDVDLGSLLCAVEAYDKYRDMINEKEREILLGNIK